MEKRLTTGPIGRSLLAFSLPMILGNLLQQLYNVADTLIVGKTIGPTALSAVGSSYALMVLLTSMILGLCMGSGVVFSHLFGAGRLEELKTSIWNALVFVFLVSAAINGISYLLLEPCIVWLKVPAQAVAFTRTYLRIILAGMFGVLLYVFVKAKDLCPRRRHRHYDHELLRKIISNSVLTSIQQSIMNFGILMVQGLVNSFGFAASAAFAAVVKIDAFAYMPAQDFGNAFSTFIAQNHGAKQAERIHKGTITAMKMSSVFCVLASGCVYVFARPLMRLFVKAGETEIIAIGVQYLHIEGVFYVGIGLLFLLYGLFRGYGRAGVSIVLTVVSLGSRVALAYALSAIPAVGMVGIWWSVPIGWALADIVGIGIYLRERKQAA